MGGLTVLGFVLAAGTGNVRWVFLSLPVALLLVVMARFAPTGYRLGADGVVIDRRVGPALIPYRAIRSVDRAPRPIRGLTLTASRGIFGHFGRFWNPTLQLYRLFVTDTERIVWLGTTEGWVGLSPADPDEFMARLRARL